MSRERLQFPEWARRDPADAALSRLRAPVRGPDLSSAILSRVEAQQPFLNRSGRRWRLAWLVAGALTLGLIAAGSVTIGRSVARSVPGIAPTEPLAEVVSCAVDETAKSVRSVVVSGRSLLLELAPMPAVSAAPSRVVVLRDARTSAVEPARPDVTAIVGRAAMALRPLVLADDAPVPSGVVLAIPRIDSRLIGAVSATTARIPQVRLSFGQSGAPRHDEPLDFADEIAARLIATPGAPNASGAASATPPPR